MDKKSREDVALFRDFVKDIKPLSHDKVVPPKPRRRPKKRISFHESELIEDKLSDHVRVTVTGGEALAFSQPGLQPQTMRDLRQGKIRPQAVLDLHGMTVVNSRKALIKFLLQTKKRAMRCVLVIHGKGKFQTATPILKNQVNSWLRQHENILAFCSAKARDGGAGAVYVLLKR